jgi:hypothetical protein
MAEELYNALQQFHRDVVVPDMQGMLQQFHREVVLPEMQRFQREVVIPEMQGMLLTFHRDVVIPDMQRMLLYFHRNVAVPEIAGTLREELAAFKRETQANFDVVWKHFETLDSEYHSLSAAVKRIEEKLES